MRFTRPHLVSQCQGQLERVCQDQGVYCSDEAIERGMVLTYGCIRIYDDGVREI
jgi:hypothetical protein